MGTYDLECRSSGDCDSDFSDDEREIQVPDEPANIHNKVHKLEKLRYK